MAEERRVEPGQRLGESLSHRTINTMIELVRQQRLERLDMGFRQGGEALPRQLAGGLEVLVLNQSGAFQPAGSVLSVQQGTPLDPAGHGPEFLARPCFYGAAPLASSDVVAVLRDGLAAGQIGPAVLQGLAAVSLDVTSTAHQYAQPVAGDPALMTSGTAGHRILWAATPSTGVQQAVVLLNPPTPGGTLTFVSNVCVPNVATFSTGSGGGGTGISTIIVEYSTYSLPDFTLQVRWCVDNPTGCCSQSGTGTGTGGGGGGITVTELAFASTGHATASTLSIANVTVAATDLVVLKSQSHAAGISSASLGGNALTRVTEVLLPDSATLVELWTLTGNAVASGTLTVTYSSAVTATIILEAVHGLAHNATDQVTTASGTSNTPSVGPITTTQAAEFVTAVFGLKNETASFSWGAWGGSFTADQRVSAVSGTTTYGLEDADIITSSTGTFTASLSGLVGPPLWGGIIVSFK